MARAQRTAASGRSNDAKNPFPGGHDLAAGEAGQLATAQLVVLVEHVPPAPVTHLRGQGCRVDDVGEQQRGQLPVRVGAGAGAGEELLDLVQQAVDALGEGQVVGARELDEPCPWIAAAARRDSSTGPSGRRSGRAPGSGS
jgi:hypothetical protein